jgi:hypothetical protein
MSLPLWKLLLKQKSPNPGETVACDDCFTILTFLADEFVRGTDAEMLIQVARRHLSHFTGCRERLLQQLDELEARLAAKPASVL